MTHSDMYLPFMTGTYSTLPGLTFLDRETLPKNRKVFQVDGSYQRYLINKQKCREEGIHKYYLESGLPATTIQRVNRFIFDRLVKEYSEHFTSGGEQLLYNDLQKEEIRVASDWMTVENSIYLSLFDALASQVPEDLAVFQLTESADYLAAIHLCSPNHWSPADKIGRPFDEIHRPVAGMESTLKHYPKMLQSIVEKGGPFLRFAWGLGTDDRLNHHPVPPPTMDKKKWDGRSPEKESPIFVRVERQTLTGFPEVNAFLFTIRTYLYDVATFRPGEKEKLWEAVASMSPASLAYKGLAGWLPELKRRLGRN